MWYDFDAYNCLGKGALAVLLKSPQELKSIDFPQSTCSKALKAKRYHLLPCPTTTLEFCLHMSKAISRLAGWEFSYPSQTFRPNAFHRSPANELLRQNWCIILRSTMYSSADMYRWSEELEASLKDKTSTAKFRLCFDDGAQIRASRHLEHAKVSSVERCLKQLSISPDGDFCCTLLGRN